MARILYTVKEAAEQMSLSVNMVRNLVMAGTVRSVKIGAARRIPHDAITEYVKRLEAEQVAA